MVRLSGPKAQEFGDFLMDSVTAVAVKGEKEGSRGCLRWSLRMILRVDLLEVWREMEENCLLKELAMCLEEVRVLGPKEMGWLGGGEDFLPERDLRRDQYLTGFEESEEERVSCHFCLLCREMELEISSSSCRIQGLEGSCCWMVSHCWMRRGALGGRFGV